MRTKLIRNVKPGDKFTVSRSACLGGNWQAETTATVTVQRVQETSCGYISGKRRWMITGNYPWWWPHPIMGYSHDRIQLI